MRWLLRLLLFWAICAPLFYLFGLPYLTDMLSKKAQKQGYTQCIDGIRKEGLIGSPGSPLTPDQGEKYCHCMSDGLILTQDDVFDLVQKKPAAGLNALSQRLSETCNRELQQSMGFIQSQPQAAPQPVPAPDSNMQPLGQLP